MTTTEAAPPPASDRPAGAAAEGTAPEPVDENIWLEEIYGDEQLAWVREQNARTEELLEDAEYAALEASILEVLDSTDRIAMVGKHGEWYYNFWKDRQNPKGLWRRTSWDSYRGGSPEWDVLLDVDALAAAEGEEWVFHGASFLRPAEGEPHRLALLALSPDGGDANRYREFDVESRSFVDPAAGGFDLPTAKGNASWLDADTLLVASTAEGLPSTTSSYARTGVKLRRGGSLAAAERLFEIPEDHMMALVAHDSTPGFERTFAVDWISFFEKTTSVLREGQWVQLDVPVDVNLSSHREWLLFRPQKDWTVGATTYPAGSLLAAGFEAFLAGSRDLSVLFTPDEHTSLQSWSWTRDFLLLNLLRDVSSEIRVLDPQQPGTDTAWASTVLDACPPLHDVNAYAVDDEDTAGGSDDDSDDDGTDGAAPVSEAEAPGAGNDFWLVATGFTTPSTLTRGTLKAERRGDATAGAVWTARTRWSGPRRRSSTKRPMRSSSTLPCPRTAPGCRTSRWRPRTWSWTARTPRSSPATAASKSPGPPRTAARSAGPGWNAAPRNPPDTRAMPRTPAAASTSWPTSAAAANTGPRGTARPCRRSGTGPTRISPRWPRT